jgi:sn-glycerol 3-phosphate transport system ATP-binding protein
VGVRAEAARIDPAGVAARVRSVEYLGADSLVDVRIGDDSFTVRMPGKVAVAAGEEVCVAWEAGASHWFDATSGQRIA